MRMCFLKRVDHFAEVFTEQLEKRKLWFLCGVSLVYLAGTCWLASRKLMWFDEFFTFYIAQLPSVSDIWSALSTGADITPPPFHIITRASLALFGVNHLAVRLPEVLGFWGMSLCLFQFVSKRSSALYGFVAVLFPLVTNPYYYAYEARPYGLVLGFCGLSLLCWQAAAEGHSRTLSLIGLAVSVAAAVSNHYYAVLLLVPLAVGEGVRSFSQRRLDLPIWVAFGAAMTPLLLFLPLIERAKTYSATFWAKASWGLIPRFYTFLLQPAVLPLVAILIVSAVYATTHPISYSRRNQASHPMPPMYEIAAAFGFIAIPVVAVILAKLVTGAFTGRYALPSVIGFSMILAFAAYRLLEGRALMGTALVLFYCGWFMVMEVHRLSEINAAVRSQANTYKFLQSASESGLPIVTPDAGIFMELTHYAPRALASRLVYLADPEASLRHDGRNTVDRALLDLKPWFRLNIEEYGPYVASQRQFFVYSTRGTWLHSELMVANMRLELRSLHGAALLVLASPKE